jgi:hypothetical protein
MNSLPKQGQDRRSRSARRPAERKRKRPGRGQDRAGRPPVRAGFRNIEAASFVSPKWVPQMATSAEVMAGIERRRA